MESSGDHVDKHAIQEIRGQQCIVWNFGRIPDDKKHADREKTARRKAKDKLGLKNKDVFMIDSKYSSDGVPKFCDAIVVTDKLKAWDNAISKYYGELYTVKTKQLSSGYRKCI